MDKDGVPRRLSSCQPRLDDRLIIALELERDALRLLVQRSNDWRDLLDQYVVEVPRMTPSRLMASRTGGILNPDASRAGAHGRN